MSAGKDLAEAFDASVKAVGCLAVAVLLLLVLNVALVGAVVWLVFH